MTRTASLLRLSLVLAPLLGLASACDKGEPKKVATTTASDSEGDSDSDSSTSSDDSTSTSGATEGETDTSSSSSSTTDECAGEFLLADMTPEEIAVARAEAAESWGEPEYLTWCEGEHEMPCTTSQGEAGTSLCVVLWGADTWTTCAVEHACTPDTVLEQQECQGSYCALIDGVLTVDEWISEDPCCGTNDPCCWTPLVVSFDGEPIRFEAAAAAAFDIGGEGSCLSTDWPAQPWLALDRDGDGVIGSGRELFGSGTIMTTGARATHGFEALGEFDVDRDGKITAADPIFHELVLWSDHDSDRRGALGELVPVAQAELIAIDLGFGRRYDCDARGNCGVERSAFEFRDERGAVRTGEVVDVHLPCQ